MTASRAVEALRLAWALEDRGATFKVEGTELVVDIPGRLNDAERAEIRRWKRHLMAIATYEIPAAGEGAVSDDAGYLPLRRLAAYSGLSVRRLRDYLHDPIAPLPHYRIGGKILVRRTDFDSRVGRFRSNVKASVDRVVDDLMHGLR